VIEQNQFTDTIGSGNGIELTGDYNVINENILEGNRTDSSMAFYLVAATTTGDFIVSGNRAKGYTKGVDSAIPRTMVQSCSISTYGANHAIRLGAAGSHAVGNSIPVTAGQSTGVIIEADDCVVSDNAISDAKVGVKVSATAGKFWSISGNRINVLDVADAIGVDISKSTSTDCYGTVINNVITKGPTRTTTSGCYGINATNANKVACAGNNIRQYYSGAPDFAAAINGAGGAFGLGMNISGPNSDTYNLFQTV
jgi:hypothetical protein